MFIGDITTTETPVRLLWQLSDKQMSQDEIMRKIKVQSSVCVIVFNARKSANAHWARIKSGASVRKKSLSRTEHVRRIALEHNNCILCSLDTIRKQWRPCEHQSKTFTECICSCKICCTPSSGCRSFLLRLPWGKPKGCDNFMSDNLSHRKHFAFNEWTRYYKSSWLGTWVGSRTHWVQCRVGAWEKCWHVSISGPYHHGVQECEFVFSSS